jgi:succinate dehydrogenase / fumarate reductase cytochrome b subunit
MVAWLIHRVTGLALVLYLVMHFYVLGQAQKSQDAFNKIMMAFHSPIIKVFEIVLLFGVIYHTINGIRVLLFDVGILKGNAYKWIFWVFMVIGLGLFVVGGYYIWS